MPHTRSGGSNADNPNNALLPTNAATGGRLYARACVLLLVIVATLGGSFGGPGLGDHEAIVAQCAREMRLTGDWTVPRIFDTPFIRKPPLPYWLTALSSYIFPNDPGTNLPVSPTAARFPSTLAALGTVLLLWRLASSMFSRRIGQTTALLSAGTVAMLLYASNATAEMVLTFCCTWAFMHFWFAITAESRSRRCLHMLLFYLAWGVGMLAKGPAPLAMVAVPLAVWWYVEFPARVLARGGPSAAKRTAGAFVRTLQRRTHEGLTGLWILPGVLIFLAVFVPWIIAVARECPHAWDIWNWQYVQRFEGDYEDTRVRGFLYYVPVALGLLAPWTLSIVEALASPWMKRYRRYRRGLWYAAAWGLGGVVVMSAMEFKKPYYIVPALPGLMLMLAVVVDYFFSAPPRSKTRGWLGWAALAACLVAGVVWGHLWMRDKAPDLSGVLTVVAAIGAVAFGAAGVFQVIGRCRLALATVAVTMVIVFQAVWYAAGPRLDNVGKVAALDAALDEAGVPDDATIIWGDMRPDARLSFYFARKSGYVISPSEIVTKMVDRTGKQTTLEQLAAERAQELLSEDEPRYLLLRRRSFDQHKSLVSELGRELTHVHRELEPPAADWLVITNGR